MNLVALPGKLVTSASGNLNKVDSFFNSQPVFTQASPLGAHPVNTEIRANKRYGIPGETSYKIRTAEDRARTSPLSEPITVGFKMFINWQKDYGLLCDGDLTEENYKNTKNNSAVAYLYRIGEKNRAELLKRWIYNFKQLLGMYDFLFLHVEGLDIVQNRKVGHFFTEDDKLNIVLRETVDMKVQALINTYNKIWYDDIRGVEVIPSNLRKFDAYIMVYDVNYYSSLLYDYDVDFLSDVEYSNPKYKISTYMDIISDVDGKLERGEISQKEYDAYNKKYDIIDSKVTDLYNSDMEEWEKQKKKITGTDEYRRVLPTKLKVEDLQKYDIKSGELTNNFNGITNFNHMIYEFKSLQIDYMESGKGFVGNVSNEPTSEFVRNNISFTYKRAYVSGEFYNMYSLKDSDGNLITANPGELLALASIQDGLNREVEIIESGSLTGEDDSIIALGEAVVTGKKKTSTSGGSSKITVDWKGTGNSILGLVKNTALQAGREIGREIWNRQKNKILSQNSVIGNLINVYQNVGIGRIATDLIKDNLGYKVGEVVNKNINTFTDILPTKTDKILKRVSDGGNQPESTNKVALMENPVRDSNARSGAPFNIERTEPLNNDIRSTNENIYEGNTHPQNPKLNTGLNVYDGTGF